MRETAMCTNGRNPTNPIAEATRRQRRAADPGAAAWVSAHAGSGKTHVLVTRVIRLMLEGTAPGRILCLTYTRAAAAEMKNRLFERLGAWIALDDATLRRRIAEDLGHTFRYAPGEDMAHARRLFARALETPGGLRIQTIHAFCERLLQAFPVEAGLPPGFEVMDELDARELLARAATRVLSGEAGEHALADSVNTLSALLREEGFAQLLHRLLREREILSRLQQEKGLLDAVSLLLAAHLGLSPSDTAEDDLESWLTRLDADLVRHVLSLFEESDKQTDKERVPHLQALLEAIENGNATAACEAGTKLFLTRQGSLQKRLFTKGLEETDPAAMARWREMADDFLALFERLKGHDLLAANRALLTLARAVMTEYERLKQRHGLYDYDDLVIRTRNLLDAQNVTASWVLYRLDGGIDHVLIDEAQDTSPAQWEIIARLTEDFCAGESARSDGRLRTVFAVGDFKQSIYSFQGAEPTAFRRMREHFARCYDSARLDFVKEEMNISFRTAPVILEAVDRVLARIDLGLGEERPEPHRPAWPDVPGRVELWPVIAPSGEEGKDEDPWIPPRHLRPPERPQQRLARRIATTIRRLVDGRTPVRDSDAEGGFRPMRWGDVLVLVQRRSGFMEAIIAALKQAGIPVAGADRLKVTDHLAVKDLMALGRFLLDREDDLSLACVLKSPLLTRDDGHPFNDDDLMHLSLETGSRQTSLWQRLQHAAAKGWPCTHAVKRLREWWRRAGFELPFDFYAGVLERDRSRRAFIERLGTEVEEPLDAFLDIARQYERDHPASLVGFLDFLETAAPEIRREMEAGKDEVRVMTVHGAKGLEAPVVFLPDTCRRPEGGKESVIRVPLSPPAPAAAMETAQEEARSSPAPAGDIGFPFWIGRADLRNARAEALREAWMQRRMQEYWRLLYVAMTRARDRLYIGGALNRPLPDGNAPGKDKSRDPLENTWYAAIRDALFPAGEGDPHAVRDAEGHILCWRMETGASPTAGAPEERQGPTILPSWVHTQAPPAPGPSLWLAPSRLARIFSEADTEDEALARAATRARASQPVSPLRGDPGRIEQRRFARGILVHRLLQHLPDLPADTRRETAVTWLMAPPRDLPKEAAIELADEVLKVMDDPALAPLFGPESRAEVPFAARLPLADGGEMLVSGQIDRLVITDSAIIVADYKTARPAPERLDDVPEEYIRQLAVYARAMETLWPGRAVRAVLVWTATPALMEIPPERLAAAATPPRP